MKLWIFLQTYNTTTFITNKTHFKNKLIAEQKLSSTGHIGKVIAIGTWHKSSIKNVTYKIFPAVKLMDMLHTNDYSTYDQKSSFDEQLVGRAQIALVLRFQ